MTGAEYELARLQAVEAAVRALLARPGHVTRAAVQAALAAVPAMPPPLPPVPADLVSALVEETV